ncbi:sigma 54-interacting transcriptional regulator [Candidatus Desantisbacteria bacterium]|nr:sigma 54-interacting transcriptional regulator [Candidatus Desantisbacteria bacterium]
MGKSGKKINLSRLLSDDLNDISKLLKEISNLSNFDDEFSVYDINGEFVTSSNSQSVHPINKEIILKTGFQDEYYEIDNGVLSRFFYDDDPLGYIYVKSKTAEKDKIITLSLVLKDLLAEIVKLKIEKKELLQETLSSYREINLLYKFGGNISSQLDLNHVLKSVLLESKNIVKADTYAIYLLEIQKGELQLKASIGNLCPSSRLTHPDKVLANLIVKTKNSEIVNDIKLKQKMEFCKCNTTSLLGIPLKIKDELFGVIILTSQNENQFNARDEKLVFSLANQASIAIKNAYLEKINWEHKRQLALTRIINEEKEKTYKELISSSSRIISMNEKIPQDPIPYLIYGDYGVGKNLLARKIHRESSRKKSPFISIDCAIFSSDPKSYALLLGSNNIYDSKKPESEFSYMELADGGTLFLHNIDRLPKELGEKLTEFLKPGKEQKEEAVQLSKYDVRIVASSSVLLDKKIEKGEFDIGLFEILNKNIIKITPLKERKKDIGLLIEYFVKEYSISLGKSIKGIDNKAYEKLISYNYRIGNIKELKDIIERACILTESEIITSEYIFLEMSAAAGKYSYNLLNIKPVYNLIRKGIFPHSLIIVSSSFIFLIYYFAFFHENKFGANFGTFLAWSLWWPFFCFSFFFLARSWCGICPINEFGIVLRKIKHFNLKVPSFIKDNTHYFITIGLLTIIWAEEIFVMKSSAFRTGIIMAIRFSFAATINILFQRHTYCRYICGLGWTAGILSAASIIELRSNPDICANKCKTHDCFKGNDTISGCPMSLHPQFITNNTLCKLCYRCIRLCQNNSPQLNVRLPGWDIVKDKQLGQKTSILICCHLSIPFAIAVSESKKYSSYFNFSLLYWSLPVIIGLSIWLANSMFYGLDRKNNFQHYFDTLKFYIPLALGANVALQLKYIPLLSKLSVTSSTLNLLFMNTSLSFSLLSFIQGNLVFTVFLFCVFLMIMHSFSQKEEKQPVLYYLSHQIIMLFYCLLFLNFLIY